MASVSCLAPLGVLWPSLHDSKMVAPALSITTLWEQMTSETINNLASQAFLSHKGKSFPKAAQQTSPGFSVGRTGSQGQ